MVFGLCQPVNKIRMSKYSRENYQACSLALSVLFYEVILNSYSLHDIISFTNESIFRNALRDGTFTWYGTVHWYACCKM